MVGDQAVGEPDQVAVVEDPEAALGGLVGPDDADQIEALGPHVVPFVGGRGDGFEIVGGRQVVGELAQEGGCLGDP